MKKNKILFLCLLLSGLMAFASSYGQIETERIIGEDGSISRGAGDYLITQEEDVLRQQKQEKQQVEEIETIIIEEEPVSYPVGDQDFYEPRDASLKFNPYTGQYENATPNQQLRFNPSTGNWSYQSSTAKMKFNSATGKWEYTDNPYE
jgi:hypothetical protein